MGTEEKEKGIGEAQGGTRRGVHGTKIGSVRVQSISK